MKQLPTVSKAKEEIKQLQAYIQMAEEYETHTLQQQVIKSYAYTGSIQKVTALINEDRTLHRMPRIDSDFVTEFIQSKPIDDLHKILRSNYLQKTKHSRKKQPERNHFDYRY